MAHFPPWPPAAGSPSAHPSNYPPPPPPPLPPSTARQTMALPPELQALNITPQQMAALLTHLQAGTFPFPPPPPPPPPQSFQSAAPFPPVPFPTAPSQPSISHNVPAPSAVPSHMDVDREEGEVSDASQRINRATGSKKRKPRASQLAHRAAPQSNTPPAPKNPNSDKKEAVLPFIAALHQEGFTFDEFVREGFEENLLRQVYQDLRIPVAPVRVSSARVPPTEPVVTKTTSIAPTQPSAVVSVKEIKPAVPVKQAAPMSRQDYLARLQAAKNKKAEATTSKQSVQSATFVKPPATKPEAAALPIVIPPAQAPPKVEEAQTATSSPALTSSKQSQTTELIRKKMEALKATQRRLANSNTPASSAPGSLSATQAASTSTPPTNSFAGTPSAPPQSATTNLLPGIPGLRMSTSMARSPQPQLQVQPVVPAATPTSSASASSSKDSTPQPPVVTSIPVTRKRPVASDLNEAQNVVDHRPFKRPFGQSRQNSFDAGMIIEVSDDEDTSDEDDELSSAKPLIKASANLTGQRDKNIRDLPPLRDFPQRSAAFNKPAGTFTPPLGTPGVSSDAEELRRKELEITSLNQRIQEYEKRKAALKAKNPLTQSQPQTPSRVVGKTEKAAAEKHASASGTSWSKEPADRRTELKATLNARNADIVDQKARILEMQKQMADMQRQYDQDMANQQKLREELEGLDVNTDGMTQSEMEAKKQEIDNLHDLETAESATNGVTAGGDTDVSMSEGDSDSSIDHTVAGNQAAAAVEFSATHRDVTTSSPGRARVLDNIRADRAEAEQAQDEASNSGSDSDSGSSMSESSESEEDEEEEEEEEEERDGRAKSTSKVATDVSDSAESDVSKSLNDEESGAAEPHDEPVWLFVRNVPQTTTKDLLRSFFGAFDVERAHLPRQPTNDRGTGSGYVKLPVSQAVTAIDQLSGQHLEGRKVSIQITKSEPKLSPSPSPSPSPSLSPSPSAQPSSASSKSSSDDEMDISTGSDSDSDSEDSEDGVSNAAATSTEQQENVPPGTSLNEEPASDGSSNEDEDEDRMDLESSDASSEEYSLEPAAVSVSSLPQSHSSNTSRPNLADDLAPELQPAVKQQVEVHEAVSTTPSNGTTFKPYESLLKNFKGYRFHPDYPRDVEGGYRSLTYSHQIDPNKELCRYEVASGVCNDDSCEYQHFRDMAVSGASEAANF
ncbi:hypothetical protein E4T39_03711 [Aureobasidium subglaciale]|nr:hypothetical protein E4T39_03711 [Aureobasidium subglaciale]